MPLRLWPAAPQGLDLVPVLNKIDLPSADPEATTQQMASAFDVDPAAVLRASAKTGIGLASILDAIIE